MAKEKFEDTLHKLEKIVSRLEEGDLPLEESLKLFEEGIRLSRFCEQKLDEAEKRVEILLKDKEGVPKPQPFPSINSVQAPPAGSGQALPGNSGQAPSTGSGQVSAVDSEASPVDSEEAFFNEKEE